MDLTSLVECGRRVEKLIHGTAVAEELDKAIDDLVAKEEWRLLGEILLTASEISGYRILDCLIEHEQYEVVALVACLRRQLARRGVVGRRRQGIAKRVLRDFDETDEDAHIPSEIIAEAEQIAEAAERSRNAAERREAALDRDPMRQRMVNRIAEKLGTSDRALEALLVIVHACAFDDTRRGAALRLGNHAPSLRKLVEAGRTADLIAIAEGSGLQSLAQNVARAMTEQDVSKVKSDDTAALQFLAKYHPDESVREQAKNALSG